MLRKPRGADDQQDHDQQHHRREEQGETMDTDRRARQQFEATA